ncbi:unnamed protein product [Callosobruchus maculatus]|nr:unnamed protein product [Callosobruchus maculatus]
MRGNMEQSSTMCEEPHTGTGITRTTRQSMEITNCVLASETMKQVTILNQSVMDFTLVSPAPVNPPHLTASHSSIMELTCQQDDNTQGDIMEKSMDITKGVSDKGYCDEKYLPESKINTEDTIYDTVTMELTGIIPQIPVLPKITPQRHILRDTAFNESATMDFTKSLFIPQTTQPENVPTSLKGPSSEDSCILINKTVSESTSAVLMLQRSLESAHKSTNASSNEMDLSVHPSRASESQEISCASRNVSDSSRDKFGTTYTLPKKVSLGKTYLVEPDRENIPYSQGLPVTNEKQDQIADVIDKENRKPLVSVDTNKSKPILGTSYASKNVEQYKELSHEQSAQQNKIEEQLLKGPDVKQDEAYSTKSVDRSKLKPKLDTSYALKYLEYDKESFHVQSKVQNKIEEQLVKGPHVKQDETHTTELVDPSKLKPKLDTSCALKYLEHDKESFHEQSKVQDKIEEQLLRKPQITQNETHTLESVDSKILKPVLNTSYVSNKVEHDKELFHEQSMVQNGNEQQILKGPHINQDPPPENTEEVSFISEADISAGLVQNDLSAEMFMPSQQLNEDNACSMVNVLYSEKIKPPELSSHENSAAISTTSFMYDNSELDTDQLIHAEFPQPDEISRGDFSIHCQQILKNISDYLPGNRKPINFDRTARNARTRALVKRFEEMRKEMHDILSNFKIPEIPVPRNRVVTEISKGDSDSSSSVSTDPTIEEVKNDVVVVRKTVLEKVQEAAKRAQDGRWVFLGPNKNKCDYYFAALFKSIFMRVNIDPDTGIVNDYETDFNDAFVKEDLEPIFHYNAKVLDLKLKHDHVSSVIGAKYDILTFLDYLHMSADEVLKFNEMWVQLLYNFTRSHKIRMTPDYRVIIEVLNAEHVIWWVIKIKMLVSTTPGLWEDLIAKTQLGEPVKEECIKKLARSIPPGYQFLWKFMVSLKTFTEKLVHRLEYAKEAEKLK